MVLITINGKQCFNEYLLQHIRNNRNDQVKSILTSADLCLLTDTDQKTLLHFASEYGNANIAQYLIDWGVNVNSQDFFGRTPLLLAVTRGRVASSAETVGVLLTAKADILQADLLGKYPLKLVVNSKRFDDLSVVQLFFRRLAVECQGNAQLMADLLIKAGCPMERAIYLENSLVTEAMIEAGGYIHERNPQSGHTALHTAIALMDLENVKSLIKHGADATAKTGEHIPLSLYFVAAKFANQLPNPHIVKLLMDQYFFASIADEDIALAMIHTLRLGDEEAIRHMMQHNVNLTVMTSHDNTDLHFLAMNENPNVAKAFESRIANVNARNCSGCTPLIYAAAARNASTVTVFLEKGANVNEKSNMGNTPLSALFFTMSDRHFLLERTVVEILLQHGADIQVLIPPNNVTMFDYVIRNSRFDLGELLVAKLAFLEQVGEPIIDVICNQINNNRILRDYYDLCSRQLEQMKSVVMCESITLFKLLCQSEKEIIRRHVFNESLLDELQNFASKYRIDTYYHSILRDRVASAWPKIKMIRDAMSAILDLFGPQLQRNFLIVRKIIDYLSYEDMALLSAV